MPINKIYTGAGCNTSRSVIVLEGPGVTGAVPCCERDHNRDGDCDIHKRRSLDPAPSQAVRNYSPDGFNWGFPGSGPHQLALAILLDFTGDPKLALQFAMPFKWAFVATWGSTWKITSEEIKAWLVEERLK